MIYNIVSPLGVRKGFGTFETFFDKQVYSTKEEAEAKNDLVVVDFAADENNIVYFQAYHRTNPDVKKYQELSRQHFPYGLDVWDDYLGEELAKSMFLPVAAA